jgi:hypothetical protein
MSRLAAYLVLALALAGAGAWGSFVVLDWRADARQLAGVRQELTDLRARHALEVKAAQEATDGYRSELQSLQRARARQPARPVRLCQPPVQAQPDSSAPGRADGPGTAAGELPTGTGPGPDIGPDLAAIADRCDAVAAQLRGLQGWVERVSK